jgi:hypothetical protein
MGWGPETAFVEWSASYGAINWNEAMIKLKKPTYYFKRSEG